MQLNHINIRAPMDLLEREKRFFCEILGLTVGDRPDFERAGFWLYSQGQPIVHLSERDRYLDGGQRGYFDHVAFQSQGLRPFLEVLETAGIRYQSDYVEACRMTQVFFDSPTGTRIEVNFVDETL